MMGDNRDNSQDSRVENLVGPVPFENLVGRARNFYSSQPMEMRICGNFGNGHGRCGMAVC